MKLCSTLPRDELFEKFTARFGRSDVTRANLHGLCKRNGWRNGRNIKPVPKKYGNAERAYIEQHASLPRAELHQKFIAEFPQHRGLNFINFNSTCKRFGVRNGRDGRFAKGTVPWSKGKKLPFNTNSARTQFKKGSRSGVAVNLYKPIGSEQVRDGYLVRKVHDGRPMQSRWKFVHRINWEAANGPVPDGMVLKCLGDKLNIDPLNWELVSRGVLARLNQSKHDFDAAPAELKPAIMALAKLNDGLGRKRKQLTSSQRPEGGQ